MKQFRNSKGKTVHIVTYVRFYAILYFLSVKENAGKANNGAGSVIISDYKLSYLSALLLTCN